MSLGRKGYLGSSLSASHDACQLLVAEVRRQERTGGIIRLRNKAFLALKLRQMCLLSCTLRQMPF